jgi:ubiquinone/menaquinone biosynthesis C-methylase UbiE
MVEFDEKEARKTDRSYLTPDVTRQRMRTLEALQLKVGEFVLDVGCGTGLLACDMAALVGEDGRVVGIDNNQHRLMLAEQRCSDLPQVHLKQCKAENLQEAAESIDAVSCVQVLLYLPDVAAALSEMHRVLKPGGRVAIVETDWRGAVLNSFDDSLTRKVLSAFDDAVSSPNLPIRLGPLLKARGFSAVRVDAFPIVNTSYAPSSWSVEMLELFTQYALEQDVVSASDSEAWLSDLKHKGAEGSYFFCVNRFIFTAVKI